MKLFFISKKLFFSIIGIIIILILIGFLYLLALN